MRFPRPLCCLAVTTAHLYLPPYAEGAFSSPRARLSLRSGRPFVAHARLLATRASRRRRRGVPSPLYTLRGCSAVAQILRRTHVRTPHTLRVTNWAFKGRTCPPSTKIHPAPRWPFGDTLLRFQPPSHETTGPTTIPCTRRLPRATSLGQTVRQTASGTGISRFTLWSLQLRKRPLHSLTHSLTHSLVRRLDFAHSTAGVVGASAANNAGRQRQRQRRRE